jgi:hypothetical protein
LGGVLFQRQRCGLPGPRPLAFGQRPDGGSFILLLPAGEMAAALIPDQVSERG